MYKELKMEDKDQCGKKPMDNMNVWVQKPPLAPRDPKVGLWAWIESRNRLDFTGSSQIGSIMLNFEFFVFSQLLGGCAMSCMNIVWMVFGFVVEMFFLFLHPSLTIIAISNNFKKSNRQESSQFEIKNQFKPLNYTPN